MNLQTKWARFTDDPLVLAALDQRSRPSPGLTEPDREVLAALRDRAPLAMLQVDIEVTTGLSPRSVGRCLAAR